MKFHQLFTLFIVLVFLIFPPIFVTQTSVNDVQGYTQNFNRFSLFTIVISSLWTIFLYFFTEKREEKLNRSSLRISLLSFILILYISWIFQKASFFLGLNQENQKIFMPTQDKILNSIQIVILCFYEEVLYRMYLYFSLNKFLNFISEKFIKKNFNAKIIEITSIFLVAILFALAHLYSGIINVLFAFIASLVFSLIYRNTKNIIFSIIPHVLFNILIFLTLTKI